MAWAGLVVRVPHTSASQKRLPMPFLLGRSGGNLRALIGDPRQSRSGLLSRSDDDEQRTMVLGH
jgi:hypothetical protein